MKLNLNFLGGGVMQNKKPSMGGVGIFSGTVQFLYNKKTRVQKENIELVQE